MRRRRAIRPAVLAATGISLLAACASTPAPDRPQPPQVTRYTASSLLLESSAQATGSQQVALGEQLSQDWWQLFGSPAIDDIVRRAIAGNRDVAAAVADLQQAQQLTSALVAASGPVADLSAGSGRQKHGKQFLGDLGNIPPFSYFSLGGEVSDSIDFGHALRHRIAEQRANIENAAY